jgi:beta-N-acetylhexosaminidase
MKKLISLILIIILSFSMVGCATHTNDTENNTATVPQTTISQKEEVTSSQDIISSSSEQSSILEEISSDEVVSEEVITKDEYDLQLEKMTIEEKIGQMLIIADRKEKVDDELLKKLKTVKPGGFILFSENITTYSATKNFVKKVKGSSEIPMIIAIDQEGGKVQRLSSLTKPTATDIPDMFTLGSTNNSKLAKQVGKVMAQELLTIGVNVAFAPVLDIKGKNSFIGDRCFGDNPQTVTKMAINFAKGLEQNNIVATYKHFPGHGDTETDSHKELPIINKSLTALKSHEFVPFKKAIANDAKIIMVGHIALPKVTGDKVPASLSKKIVNDILIEKLNYEGLIITDALDMGAITEYYTQEEMYMMAVEAGCDILLMPKNPKKAIATIKKNISEERIDKSVKKILKFKKENMNDNIFLDKSHLGSKEHKSVISKLK